MPRGGSKKGEHRGNAKPRDGVDTPNELMRVAVKTVRKVANPKTKGPAGLSGLKRNIIEEDIHLAQLVHGRRSAYDLTPKEIMLDNMHRFQQAAYTNMAMVEFILRTPPSDERSRVIRSLELEEERNRRIASDEAYKVAGFIHPRRIAIHSDASIGDDIAQLLLDEIDRRNREHPLVIEHMPQRKTA